MQTKEINAGICPLCGQPNQCAMATQKDSSKSCWCHEATFPEELLEKIPGEFRQNTCVCKNCLNSLNVGNRN